MTPAAVIAVLALSGDERAPTSGSPPINDSPVSGPPANASTSSVRPMLEPTGYPASRPSVIVVPVLHGLGLMTVMRATETVLWPRPFAESAQFASHYEEAYTSPPKFDSAQPFMRWDGDPLFINVVGHGLFGSELYLRARQCRLGWPGALSFAALASGVWEYAFEANGVRPSALDLVYTPLAGLALGEVRFALYRVAGKLSSPAVRSGVRAALDPFGEIERAAGTDC